ncbi:MAG TPA: flagellar hook-basal body protein [Phycisphaerae bacterium]|nr:flagellar hook-basal body protein [Phycisphaerae bacterium]
MTYGLWLSAAGMQANEYRQDVLANNLANANTVGFKQDLAVIRERAVEGAGPEGGSTVGDSLFGAMDGLSGGSFVAPTYHSFAQGPVTQTHNPLDAAIDGDGFFAVRVGDDLRYTRDGRFTTNADNELVMVANGGRAKVLDDAGAPIVLLPATAGRPRIAADGTIRQGTTVVGKLGLAEFDDRDNLRKVGANLFQATGGRVGPAQRSSVLAGHVEQSTVNPIGGLASMIEVSRAYQLNANMISLQDSTIGQAVSRVGRIG